MRLFNSSNAPVNVNRWERAASIVTGAALGVLAFRRGGKQGALSLVSSGVLLHRGVTGHCALYDRLGRHKQATSYTDGAHPLSYEEGVKVNATITIERPRKDVYAFWRDLQNLPKFMWHIESVSVDDRQHSHWELKTPLGPRLHWDAEIINDIPGELIAWKSLPGSNVHNAGSVMFKDASYDRGTCVRLTMHYNAPGGKIGAAIARLLGHDPDDAAQADLDRLKHLLEGTEAYEGRSHKLNLQTT